MFFLRLALFVGNVAVYPLILNFPVIDNMQIKHYSSLLFYWINSG